MTEKKDTRPLRERMKGRTRDLDAAIDAQTAPPAKPDADSERRKAAQSTDKNNAY